jgi:predicted transporter
MTIPTIAVIGNILANSYIIWFLLIDVPSRCTYLATDTGGRQTCGMEAGGYVIVFMSALLILTGVYYLAKWNFPQDE